MRTAMVRGAQRFMLGVIILGTSTIGLAWWQSTQASPSLAWLRHLTGSSLPLDGRRIGIVAGHSGHDAGTVCSDGLTEVSVNLKVAELVARSLRSQGARVDVLTEFDPLLRNYTADAFVSIHADSCQAPPGLSGYKVASSDNGGETAAQLVECLWNSYSQATRLRPHPDTITHDMRQYHAFRLIAPTTPAVIFELGFLNNDRQLLTKSPELTADGISKGILCFLVTAR
jgi:N-acetylmuramoyl-L-alanine amidase